MSSMRDMTPINIHRRLLVLGIQPTHTPLMRSTMPAHTTSTPGIIRPTS